MDVYEVKAGTTPRFTATLVDEDGTAIALASLSTLVLTLIDTKDRAVINGRDRKDALNANNVTVHATSGLVTWAIQAADLPGAEGGDYHFIFEWSWSSGAKKGWKEGLLRVTPVPRPR